MANMEARIAFYSFPKSVFNSFPAFVPGFVPGACPLIGMGRTQANIGNESEGTNPHRLFYFHALYMRNQPTILYNSKPATTRVRSKD
ncbi:MAG: hypothetical protein C4575_12520 [Desulforudis sp.]|nr:MAG: hypothetical protein C4575_12520 [Desulforudis sp.]